MQTHSETLCHLGWSKLPFDWCPLNCLYTAIRQSLRKNERIEKGKGGLPLLYPFPRNQVTWVDCIKRGALALWVFFLSDLSQIKDQAEQAELSSVSRKTSCLATRTRRGWLLMIRARLFYTAVIVLILMQSKRSKLTFNLRWNGI